MGFLLAPTKTCTRPCRTFHTPRHSLRLHALYFVYNIFSRYPSIFGSSVATTEFKPFVATDLGARLLMRIESLSCATNSTQGCGPLILQFPTEILYKIFDLLTPRGKILMDADDFADILAVRSTCRAFRVVSNTLKFWYDEHFCISSLVPRSFDSSGKFEAFDRNTRTLRLFECFKADRILMETMGRKSAWSFSFLSLLIAASQHVPSFRQSLVSLYYEPCDPDYVSTGPPQLSINIGLELLAFCPNMTTLNISSEKGDIFLDHIVSCCPSLKKLEFYCNDDYTGTLRGLCNLQELIIWNIALDDDISSRQNLLPVDSAATLTRLELTYIHGPPDNVYHSEQMRAFTNLSAYSILPLCDKICDTLMNTQFAHLRTFVASAGVQSNISVHKILEILASRSLSSLQTLHLMIEPFCMEFNASYLDIIRTIATRLSSTLEELQLTMGINTAWCRHFSSLRKLKKFIWVTADLEYCESDDSSALPCETDYEFIFEGDYTDVGEMVKDKMIEAFYGFEKLPSIHIIILDENEYKDWDHDHIMDLITINNISM